MIEIRPATAYTHRSRVIDFTAALSDVDDRAEAAEALRSLIDKIVMVPDAAAPDRHLIELYGDIAIALKFRTPLTTKRLRVNFRWLRGQEGTET